MDKPLSEWTMKEAKQWCKKQTNCDGCTLHGHICNAFHYFGDSGKSPCNYLLDEPILHPKPRLAEVLGVDVGEKFRVHPCSCYFWIRPDGDQTSDKPGLEKVQELGWILNAINHPENIIRAPRLTEAELAICKAVGAKWVSYDRFAGEHATEVTLWGREPKEMNGRYTDGEYIGHVYYRKFPSVHHGDCICVEEVQHDA